MDDYSYLLLQHPEYISKEQLRIVCHISKRKALYLLKSGLIPCTDSGKRTRKYKVAMRDVITYLKDREIHPERYKAPQAWYAPLRAKQRDIIDIPQEQLTEYYEMCFADYPDVLSLKEAAEITGFVTVSLCKWIKAKRFRAIPKGNTYLIPKSSLIGYMVTPEYRKKPSQKTDYIGGFIKWQEQLS